MNEQEKKALIKYFQEGYNETANIGSYGNYEIAEDGIWGPRTKAALAEYLPNPDVMQEVWDFALTCVGKGGDGVKNNEGEWLDTIRGTTGLRKIGGGSWCMVFISYLFGTREGMHYDTYISVRHRSCAKAYEQMVESGLWEELDDASDMRVGEVCIGFYGRGNLSGKRHVRLVKRTGELNWRHIGGNERGDKVRSTMWTETGIERRMTCLMRLKA
jgi:hypothetical protein